MKAVKGKKTRLEKRFFSMLAGMNLKGWRQNASDISGKPDVAFINEKVAIFIDGCFWHGCPFCKRKLPQTNHRYWANKIARNVELAKFYNKRLRNDGWIVIRVWEHQIANDEKRRKVRSKIQLKIKSRHSHK